MALPTVGLTGGIASGKSTVARAFRGLGVPVCDADQIARQIVAPGSPALEQIVQAFGPNALTADGELDRPAMRKRVFADPQLRQRLEQITHPAIREGLLRWRDGQDSAYCIFEVAILFESGMDRLVDRSLVIDVPEALQLQRLQQRDGTDAGLARQMLASQLGRDERKARATDLLHNDSSEAELISHVASLHQHYLAASTTDFRQAAALRLPPP